MKSDRFRIALCLLTLGLTPLLSGCFGAAVVGVGAGALVIADRRVSETYLADEAIELRIATRVAEQYGERAHVNATSYNRMVLLTGEVPDIATRNEIEKTVAKVPNVATITNELRVAPVSSISGRADDTYITSKVKARFIDYNQFSVNHVKVVTEAGAVHLLGLVTQREADAAADIARTTKGVAKVVRVLEIISEDEARRLDQQAKKNPEPASR